MLPTRFLKQFGRTAAVCLTLLVGTAFAATWLPFGPDGGDARRIVLDPSDARHLFLGSANGWLYESRNAGANWKRISQIAKMNNLVVDSIVVDPKNSRHLIVGGWVIDHADGGIFISNDGGASWLNQAEMRGQSVRSLAIAPSDPKILVAGSLQGVFQSQDGGQRWKRISPRDSTEIHEVESVAIDPVDPQIIYAGTWHLPWKTTDGGEHWDNITRANGLIDDSDVFSIIVDPDEPNVVFASACSGIYKSEDAGAAFHKIEGIPATSRRTRVLLQDPTNRKVVYAGTTEGLFKSEDSGKTWTSKTGPEIIVNDVSVDPANSKHVLIATDRGGVLASDDAADTFHPSNGGFSARQVTAMLRDSQHPAVLYVGVVNDKEWGGVFKSENGGLGWTQISQGLQGRDVFSLGKAPDGSILAGTAHGLYKLDADEVWQRVQVRNEEPVEPQAPVSAEPALVRAPVPVGRNHYAESKPYTVLSPNQKKALLSAARKRAATRTGGRPVTRKLVRGSLKARRKVTKTIKRPVKVVTVRRPSVIAAEIKVSKPASVIPAVPVKMGFDGSVFGLVTAEQSLLAITSEGVLRSDDDAATWSPSGPPESSSWRMLSAAKANVVTASMDEIQFSSDAGRTWVPIRLPEALSRVAAVTVEPTGAIWAGGREGVFVTQDAGETWMTPKNLYVTSVSNLFYDQATNRVLLTTLGGTGSYNGLVFTVQLPQRQVTYVDTGWSLRFARPVGDHLVAATLYDGIVVQPKMIASPTVQDRKLLP